MAIFEREVEERFWAKVDQCGPDECWPWTAGRLRSGYGEFKLRGRTLRVHRIAYELEHGPIPEGLCVLHRCDNRPCCNPAHLLLGDYAMNNAEMRDRGRAVSPPKGVGEHNPSAKLTLEQVQEIRESYQGRRGEQSALARQFGVTQSAIYRIVNRLVWA